jgi:hypothetical protein
MRLASLGIDKDLPTVVVLGAGASRGSSCARTIGIAPPVDADFFEQAQRMPSSELLKRDRDLFTFVKSEFGHSNLPTLEVFFTQIAAVDRFHHEFNIQGRVSGKFSTQLATLRSLIPRVFKEALGGMDCRWHERVGSSLRASDAVLSFNYDTLIDRALRTVGGKRWVPDVGYGFNMGPGTDLWSPPPKPGPAVRRPILLLKPHGSLNWSIDKTHQIVSMVEEYSTSSAGSIVPPTWDKADVGQWPWNDVWRSARRVLGAARMLIVIGYSVPVTDQLSQALLRADVNKLGALVVVNPDENARRRVVDVMSSALEPNATVAELHTLEDFASYLPPSPTEPPSIDVSASLNRLRRDLRRLAERVDAFQKTVSGTQSDFGDAIEELQAAVDDLSSADESELADEVRQLRDDVRDLDARVDSIIE